MPIDFVNHGDDRRFFFLQVEGKTQLILNLDQVSAVWLGYGDDKVDEDSPTVWVRLPGGEKMALPVPDDLPPQDLMEVLREACLPSATPPETLSFGQVLEASLKGRSLCAFCTDGQIYEQVDGGFYVHRGECPFCEGSGYV